ncbi:MAG: CPBP family glutamic-type intramembrane protease [Candidatus Hodarchaeales archaeon]
MFLDNDEQVFCPFFSCKDFFIGRCFNPYFHLPLVLPPITDNPAEGNDKSYCELSPIITSIIIISFFVINLLMTSLLSTGMPPDLMSYYSGASLVEIVFSSFVVAIVEEFFFRFFLIAFVAEAFKMIFDDNKSPKWIRLALVGQQSTIFRISRLQMTLIFSSSLIFSGLHVQGYGFWKLIPTFFTGLALGLVFCWHGLSTSIVVHALLNITIIVTSIITWSCPAGLDDMLVTIAVVVTVSMVLFLTCSLKQRHTKTFPDNQP